MAAGRRARARLPGWVAASFAISFLAGSAAAEEFTARVVGVTDGDTLTVLHASHAEKVRLLGVDAPEKRQAYGERAKRFTADLAFGRTVTVRAAGRDRNGRLLGEVVLADGRSLNQELVRAGYAWWFRKYSRDGRLARLEEEARASRRGLWADQAPEPPGNYRVQGRGTTRTSPWRPPDSHAAGPLTATSVELRGPEGAAAAPSRDP